MHIRDWLLPYGGLGLAVGLILSGGRLASELWIAPVASLFISAGAMFLSSRPRIVAGGARAMVGAALIGGAGAAGLLHLALWALALEEPRPLSAVMLEFYAPALLLTAISALATLRVRLRRQLDERSRPARSEPGHSIPAALALRLGGETILIPYAEINYLSSRRNTTVLHASGRDHALKQSLKAILARLPQDKFIRIHKQYAIAIDRLAALQGGQSGNYVQLRDDDDTRLPVGRAYASRLRQLVAELRPAPIQGQRKVSG